MAPQGFQGIDADGGGIGIACGDGVGRKRRCAANASNPLYQMPKKNSQAKTRERERVCLSDRESE